MADLAVRHRPVSSISDADFVALVLDVACTKVRFVDSEEDWIRGRDGRRPASGDELSGR